VKGNLRSLSCICEYLKLLESLLREKFEKLLMKTPTKALMFFATSLSILKSLLTSESNRSKIDAPVRPNETRIASVLGDPLTHQMPVKNPLF